MKLLITGKMGNGTIQAKLEPLSQVPGVEKIYFLRKTAGPEIERVNYILLPRMCKVPIINFLVTPLILAHYARFFKVKIIIGYHVVPYALFSYVASRLSGRPYIICQTGIYIQKLASNPLHWCWIKTVIKSAIVFCNPGLSSYNFWLSKGVLKQSLKILHSTIDTDRYLPSDNSKEIDFIFVGRFSVEKRIDILLESFFLVLIKYPEAKLTMVGDGRDFTKMRELSKSLNMGNSISFVGFHDNVYPYLKQSKYIVLSSDSEGLPCCIMEAMSSGVVPVTTDAGNLSEIVINNETGFCVPKGSITEFSSAMINAYEMDEESYNRYSCNAREIIVDKHSHLSSVSCWKGIISKIS